MSRLHITLFLLLFFLPLARSQQFDVCMEVVASGGTTGFQGNRYYAWTIGESFIATADNAGFLLTQGFHQPDPCGKSFVSNYDLADWGLALFPNPTEGVINLRYDPDKKGILHAMAFDLTGRLVMDRQILSNPEGSLLDTSGWLPGVYMLVLQDPTTLASTTLRVVRI